MLKLAIVLELFEFDDHLRIIRFVRVEALGEVLVLGIQGSKSENEPLKIRHSAVGELKLHTC